jgi:serine/threonine protein phosphatase PrpC
VTAVDGRSTEDVPCPNCGHLVGVWDGYCEVCGTELASPVVSSGTPGHAAQCPVCTADPDAPAGGVSPDGYCEVCGRKVPSDRDHVEVDLGLLAGISDRGLRHSRNEDAMALATSRTPDGQVAIAVVCDGVSTSPRPDDASLAAAQAAVRELLTAARLGDDLEEASLAAVRLASGALRDLAGPDGAPACTYTSAVVSQGSITVCWVGDSRVYWLAAGDEADHAPIEQDAPTRPVTEVRAAMAAGAATPSALLTRDDSLAAELVATGLLSEEDAMASPQAHVITQWLGADSPDLNPHVARFEPTGPGVLLVCSDGLWNYQPEPPDLSGMALPKALTSPLDAVAVLVKFANDAGGRDNITAVLVPFPLGTP